MPDLPILSIIGFAHHEPNVYCRGQSGGLGGWLGRVSHFRSHPHHGHVNNYLRLHILPQQRKAHQDLYIHASVICQAWTNTRTLDSNSRKQIGPVPLSKHGSPLETHLIPTWIMGICGCSLPQSHSDENMYQLTKKKKTLTGSRESWWWWWRGRWRQ